MDTCCVLGTLYPRSGEEPYCPVRQVFSFYPFIEKMEEIEVEVLSMAKAGSQEPAVLTPSLLPSPTQLLLDSQATSGITRT